MDLSSNTYRVDIGNYVHPVMLRRQAFELAFAGDYVYEKNRILSYMNLCAADINELKYHAEHVVNFRLRELATQPNANLHIHMMYTWIQNQQGALLKEVYVDVLIVANSPFEKRHNIEYYLSRKYGFFLQTLQATNRHAYRL